MRGWELADKQLGLIGCGRIGTRIADLASAFGMHITWHDPELPQGAQSRTLNATLEKSDVVMLACSRKRGEPPLLGKQQLQRMKHGTYLVNPARSALVDADAVLAAIRKGSLAGYAVDDRVFGSNQLVDIEEGRILQTAHTAWYSNEAMARGLQEWTDGLLRLAKTYSEV